MNKEISPCAALDIQENETCPGLCDAWCQRESMKNKTAVVDLLQKRNNLDPKKIAKQFLWTKTPEYITKKVEILIWKILNTKYNDSIVKFISLEWDNAFWLCFWYAELKNGKNLVFCEKKDNSEIRIPLHEIEWRIKKLSLNLNWKPEVELI
ncbi:MAG: hypothetical protein ACD_4C00399G0004 [uncultured bacterium (gcode 4)]|uniref:Uncharacterized protein n=1 Tax=uncultured bacterium (gcode 4) TaxID=1234023 RepID=K2F537_9BACT|nr:MAG: hypothetical protein ACD_4C00399G0004 [uncultured bacterium (gcode 4)]